MSNETEVKRPPLTNAEKQRNYKARLKNMAERGAAAIHTLHQLEDLVNWLAEKGDATAVAIAALSETPGPEGWLTGLATRRHHIMREERDQLTGKAPRTAPGEVTNPTRAKAKDKAPRKPRTKAVGSVTVAPSKGSGKARGVRERVGK